jgi:TonB family protein
MKSILLTLATISFVVLVSFTNTRAQSDSNPDSVDAKLLSAPAPKYPDEAKKTGLGGKVSVLVALDENGNVTGVERVSGPDWVCEAVAYPDVVALREAAKSAALRAKFTPAVRDGKPTTSTILVIYDFKGKAQASGGFAAGGMKQTRLDPNEHYKIVGSISSADSTLPSTLRNTSSGTGQTVSGGVLNGKEMSLAKPPYPAAARAVRAYGAVSVQVLIDTDGYVYSAQAMSGHPLLQSVSRIAACNSRFTQTLLMGEPVKVSGIIIYNFVP